MRSRRPTRWPRRRPARCSGRRHRGRRPGHRTGRAGPGRAAVVRDRRRRVPALLRRRGQLRAGLRRQGDRSRRGERELSALDLRHRPHPAQARRARVRPLDRRAGHPSDADGRPPAARQDRVARSLRSCRDARRRRFRHQPAAGVCDRRRRAEVEGRSASRRVLPQFRRQSEDRRYQTHQPGVLEDAGCRRIRPGVVLYRRYRQRNRRRRRRHLRRAHAQPDDDRRPGRLRR